MASKRRRKGLGRQLEARPEVRVGQRGKLHLPAWQPGPTARSIGAEAGMDLAHYLSEQNRELSVRSVRRALERGTCRVNGRVETFGSRKLRRGDVVEFEAPRETGKWRFERKRVLHEDDHIIAYDKPPALPVTPVDGSRRTCLLDLLRRHYQNVHAVHRLDADTSGIVLFARTTDARDGLEAVFREHALRKRYLAVVRGQPPQEGQRRSYLVRCRSQPGTERWRSGRGQNAREAITRWRVVEALGSFASLVEVEPQTGRHHQIRLHFAEMGHPLIGDRVYGDRADPVPCQRQMLHADRIDLAPRDGLPALHIRSAMPGDLRRVCDDLRRLKK